MNFDKAKAMRNAERHVAQGKIRAAIDEYRTVINNDPRDIATLNMLGDLYAKSSEKREAVDCYLQVAEHYGTQGFAQKAIAVYNKISRIQPHSIEVSVKLAELHKQKGSLSEAREHYTMLAEHYEKNGQRLEALAMYKEIALLDPNNTEVCMSLGESFVREAQLDDAVEAYAEAGARFSRQNNHEEAIQALMKGYDIRSNDLRILNGLIKAETALGRALKAASLLEEILENEPYNRDVLYLLIECCIDSQNAEGAEKAVIKLVEIEPANYMKFLDLIRIYLNADDTASAARILTMSSEYMLAEGQGDECGKWINEILEREPGQLAGLRLLVNYNAWLNDENGFRLALERLYSAATNQSAVEDERFALAQLVVIRPQETRYRDRLNEINEEHGFDESVVDEELLAAQFIKREAEEDAAATAESNGQSTGFDIENFHADDAEIPDEGQTVELADEAVVSQADEQRIQKEIESITFYIENDYNDLAEKALASLAKEFGDRPEFAALRSKIGAELNEETPAVVDEETSQAVVAEEVVASTLGIDEIRSEFGLEDGAEKAAEDDYETHHQMAIAYQEMGLMEQAISEFQDAIALTEPDDGTRRFFHCANLLGHCFFQNGMAHHAITWINRALETPDISDEEHHGLWYELALAYEANGDDDKAATFFEKIYAENVHFRDIGERVKNLVAS